MGVPEVTEGQLQRSRHDLEGSPGGPGTPEGNMGVVEVTEWHLRDGQTPQGHLEWGEMLRGASQGGGGDVGHLQWDRNDSGTFSGGRGHSGGFSAGVEMAPGPSWGTGIGTGTFSGGLVTPQVSQVPPGSGWDISKGMEPPGDERDWGQTPLR